jgi:hypothetical protein
MSRNKGLSGRLCSGKDTKHFPGHRPKINQSMHTWQALGMQPCEKSDAVSAAARTHRVLLSGNGLFDFIVHLGATACSWYS